MKNSHRDTWNTRTNHQNPRSSRRRHFYRHFYIWTVLIIGLYLLVQYSPVRDYVTAIKLQNEHTSFVSGQYKPGSRSDEEMDKWMEMIKAEATRLKEAPVNAKVDPVWKAIPGYNGIEVDIEKTIQENIKKAGTTEPVEYIMREIEPDIQLEHLGAHPIYKGNPKKKMVAFMINVAWGDEYLPGMIETLRRENVSATFFFDGSWLAKHLDEGREICQLGFECSNHAYSHPNMSTLDRAKQREEIMKTEKLLERIGVRNVWFAPPSGDYNQTTVDVAYELGLRTVLWTIDTVDWKKPEPEWIVRRISTKLEPGSLILMHPTNSSSQALEGMIEVIRGRGYAFGTVSDVLSSKRVDMVLPGTGAGIEDVSYF